MVDVAKPLVSVITVVYNAKEELEATIKSVLGQTYEKIEYIIIDGGSNDGSAEVIKKYEDKIAYWVSEKDRGIYDAMNKGIEAAHGEWLNFMNAGDNFASNDVLSKVFALDITVNHSLVYSDAMLHSGRIKKPHALAWLNYGMFAVHQGMFFRRSGLLYDLCYKIAGDYQLVVQYLKKYGKESFFYSGVTVTAFGVPGASKQHKDLGNRENLIIGVRELKQPVLKAAFYFYIRKLRNML